jgi:hypothetical protein
LLKRINTSLINWRIGIIWNDVHSEWLWATTHTNVGHLTGVVGQRFQLDIK